MIPAPTRSTEPDIVMGAFTLTFPGNPDTMTTKGESAGNTVRETSAAAPLEDIESDTTRATLEVELTASSLATPDRIILAIPDEGNPS